MVASNHPDYLEHRCDRLQQEIRESQYYNGEMVYRMRKSSQWYLTMVTEWAQSFNTPIYFCPYCGNKLPTDTPMSTETSK